jgi:hypothetical protein
MISNKSIASEPELLANQDESGKVYKLSYDGAHIPVEPTGISVRRVSHKGESRYESFGQEKHFT